MNVSIVVPARASDERELAGCLSGIHAQRYDAGRIEVLVVQYDGGPSIKVRPPAGTEVLLLVMDHSSPYAARNLGASRATGDAFLFTEPDCVPDPEWVGAHVERLRAPTVTIGVGCVAPARTTQLLELFLSYENVRDAWVFSCSRWQLYFGRPKNMAIARHRFETHGPFVEVARGGDSKLVQRVAREVSCDEVASTPAAIVRLASIRGFPSLMRHRFRHGCALEIHQSAHAAPIAFEDRNRLLREAVRTWRYGPLKAAVLRLLLSIGVLSFRVGCGTGKVWRKLRRLFTV
jgi:glycosyltransferase involved in cell wall biosynthesis